MRISRIRTQRQKARRHSMYALAKLVQRDHNAGLDYAEIAQEYSIPESTVRYLDSITLYP